MTRDAHNKNEHNRTYQREKEDTETQQEGGGGEDWLQSNLRKQQLNKQGILGRKKQPRCRHYLEIVSQPVALHQLIN
jgi:hypothetical protein